mgnify:CR=1 FL=1
MRYEMVCSLQDFFVRRTGLINFDIHKVNRWKAAIADACKEYLHWDDQKVQEELQALNIPCSVNYVAELLRIQGLKGRNGKRFTYGGHPLYYYAHEGRGQVLCHDVVEYGGLWLVVTPQGSAAPA